MDDHRNRDKISFKDWVAKVLAGLIGAGVGVLTFAIVKLFLD